MAVILCVDDEQPVRAVVERVLARAGHEAVGADGVAEAFRILHQRPVDLVICDYQMPALTGLDLLSLIREEGWEIPFIMLTGYASIEHAVAAIKAGALNYIAKPFETDQLCFAVEQALEFARLRRENEVLRREVTAFRQEREIVGESQAIRRLMQTVAMAAPTRATVLLQGESGTGKELVARAIHDQSERRERPFVTLNCAALPEGLVESALFGHEKGAFTGAVRRVAGAFERAHRGTLLLDEISEMRLDLQAKLLRVLQEQEFERVGGTQPLAVDVRIIATTNRDLAAEVAQGTFREDLFYRLSVIPIALPPLRERTDDIPLLAYRFALRTAAELGKEIRSIAPQTVELLQRHAWPGNVRELQHAVERAVILSTEPILQPHHFTGERFGLDDPRMSALTPRSVGIIPSIGAPALTGGPTQSVGATSPHAVVLHSLDVNEAERVLIQRALAVTDNNRTKAAQLLGISVRTLRNKLNGPSRTDGEEQEPTTPRSLGH